MKPLQQTMEKLKKMPWKKRLRNVSELKITTVYTHSKNMVICSRVLVLHKAGRHMEDSMVAAYIALLLGYVVMKNSVSYYNDFNCAMFSLKLISHFYYFRKGI